jgi:integrase
LAASSLVSELNPEVLQSRRTEWQRTVKGRFGSGTKSYFWLLQDPVVKDWIDAYTSLETREKKLYQLEKVLKANGIADTAELLRLSDRDIKTMVRRVAHWYLQQGKGVWAKQIAITMKGFLESQDRPFELKRSERIRSPPRKKVIVEHVPTKDEVFQMAQSTGSLRNKAIILSLFQSGVRVGCLCKWTYGLVGEQVFPNIKPPVRVRVTPNLDTKLNLYGLSYYLTGLGQEAAYSIRSYLEVRMRKGWSPQPSDTIFVADEHNGLGSAIKRENVWRIVKVSAKMAGLEPKSVWVHCLRKSFRKILNATPQIDEDTKEALMGHKLPGSRGNYFDYHDENEVMAKYSQADFSP